MFGYVTMRPEIFTWGGEHLVLSEVSAQPRECVPEFLVVYLPRSAPRQHVSENIRVGIRFKRSDTDSCVASCGGKVGYRMKYQECRARMVSLQGLDVLVGNAPGKGTRHNATRGPSIQDLDVHLVDYVPSIVNLPELN